MIVLILAGGQGSRLWPLSRKKYPKQFLNFGDSLSLLQKTVLRILDIAEHIVIATNDIYQSVVMEQIQSIDPQKKCSILVEPYKKNTAPTIAFAIRYMEEILKIPSHELILIIPSDHLITPSEKFLDAIEKAKKSALHDFIITFGIRPRKAETGYGYIEIADPFDEHTYTIKKFREKPTLEKANFYIKSDQYYWNSGMFLSKIGTFWKQFELYAKEIYNLSKGKFQDVVNHYNSFEDISIDYALLEKTKDILLYPLSIDWSDIGSWDAVYEVSDKDEDQNVKVGNISSNETKNSLIIGHKRLIKTIGIEDLLIIDTEDSLLICRKGFSQKVKQFI